MQPNMSPIEAAMHARGLLPHQQLQQQQTPVQQQPQQHSMMGQGQAANPMANPLAMLAHAKMEHSGMIIKGLLKHLHNSNPAPEKAHPSAPAR